MEAMAALIDAGLSGLRSTPSQGDAHPSGEPSPVDARTNLATRLPVSYGPPAAVETPARRPHRRRHGVQAVRRVVAGGQGPARGDHRA